MRKIKFRGWDKKSKEMFRVVMIAGNTDNPEELLVSGRGGTTQGAILMQYTGLHDKNGKEIYELDKVSVPFVDPMGKLHRDDENYKGIVRFLNGSFYICQNTKEAKTLLSNWQERGKEEYIANYGNYSELLDKTVLEVVGNELQD